MNEDRKELYPGQKFKKGYEPRYCFAGRDKFYEFRHIITKSPRRCWSHGDNTHQQVMYTQEFLGVSTLRKCDYNMGRTRENVAFTMCCFLDLDTPKGGMLTKEDIWRRCKVLDIKYPLMIETSPGRFHLKWYLEVAVNADSESQVNVWERVQSGLHRAFEGFDSDGILIHDRTRLLRNEFSLKAVNTKHGEPFEVNTVDRGDGWNSLSVLYLKLAKAGYTHKPKPKRDKSGWRPMQVRVMEVLTVMKKHPLLEGTQSDIASMLGIPLRSLEKVLAWMDEKGILGSRVIGKGKNRHKSYRLKTVPPTNIFKPHKVKIKDSLTWGAEPEEHSEREGGDSTGRLERVIHQYNNTSFDSGHRNFALFIASIALRAVTHGQITSQQAWDRLKTGIGLNIAHDFDVAEIRKTIASALRYSEGFRFSPRTLSLVGYEV